MIVNRIWQYYFGRGISRSPNNFGLMGDRPSHPEVIDYLAQRLMQHDWNLKTIHREILLSSTYRQSSANHQSGMDVDPDNQLFWRQSVRRLSAEQVRDSVLAVTGQLNEQQYGESFFQTLSREVLPVNRNPVVAGANRHQPIKLGAVSTFASNARCRSPCWPRSIFQRPISAVKLGS